MPCAFVLGCAPFDTADRGTIKSPMPPLALSAPQYMEHARAMWEELGLPALKPQPPWHGYSLGEWDRDAEPRCRRPLGGDRRGKRVDAGAGGGGEGAQRIASNVCWHFTAIGC